MAETNQETIQETSQETKGGLIQWIKDHPKTVFAIRLVLWILCAAVLPFAFIAWRYDIFTAETKMRLTGWGTVAVIILIVFVATLVKYVYKGLKPGLAKQCIGGVVKILLPLIILYMLIVSIQNSLEMFKQALGCTIICEAIGIPLNPFPSWIAQREAEEGKAKAESMSDIFWDKFFSRNGGEGQK